MKWLADENFPEPSFRYLLDRGLDVIHAGREFPSIKDIRVLEIARESVRILLSFDRDFGKLIYSENIVPPPGVVFFRILDYTPDGAGKVLIELLEEGFDPRGHFTVIRDIGIRRRPL